MTITAAELTNVKLMKKLLDENGLLHIKFHALRLSHNI
jgi:hypothetical protein